MHRGKPNWEHLDDDLHILVQCEDTEKRCRVKLANAVTHIKKLLIPAVTYDHNTIVNGSLIFFV